MSLKRIMKSLQSLGLSQRDSEVYIYLAKTGPTKGLEVINGLGIAKNQFYFIIKNLQTKQVVKASAKRPATYEAIAFDKVLELIIKIKREQRVALLEAKNELLPNWKQVRRSNKNYS